MSVVVAYLCRDESDSQFAYCLVNLLLNDRVSCHVRDVIRLRSGPRVAAARNEVVDAFLSDGRDEWLLFLDDDMTFDHDLVRRLLEVTDEPAVVGGLYFQGGESGKVVPVMMVTDTDGVLQMVEDWPRGKVVGVDACGTGCMLIHRDVLKAVWRSYSERAHPWFAESEGPGDGGQNRQYGEDVTFCLRARKLGFPVLVDTATTLGHRKKHTIGIETYDAYRAAQNQELVDA